MAEPTVTGLNASKSTQYRYCTQFYNIKGQGPKAASAQMDIHAIWSLIPHPGRKDDPQYDEQHSVDPNVERLKQPRCTKAFKEE